MGQPAARLGDPHVCPVVEGLKPHVGGPVGLGVPTVMIGGRPAATMGTVCVCCGPADAIVAGSATVLIGGRPAARLFDATAHGGVVMGGQPDVLIG